jgi:hypothetical protein
MNGKWPLGLLEHHAIEKNSVTKNASSFGTMRRSGDCFESKVATSEFAKSEGLSETRSAAASELTTSERDEPTEPYRHYASLVWKVRLASRRREHCEMAVPWFVSCHPTDGDLMLADVQGSNAHPVVSRCSIAERLESTDGTPPVDDSERWCVGAAPSCPVRRRVAIGECRFGP